MRVGANGAAGMGGVRGEKEMNGTMDGMNARVTIVGEEGDLKLLKVTSLHPPTLRITLRHTLPARRPPTTLATTPHPLPGHHNILNLDPPTTRAPPTPTTTHQVNPLRVDLTRLSTHSLPIPTRAETPHEDELQTIPLVGAESLGVATVEEAPEEARAQAEPVDS